MLGEELLKLGLDLGVAEADPILGCAGATAAGIGISVGQLAAIAGAVVTGARPASRMAGGIVVLRGHSVAVGGVAAVGGEILEELSDPGFIAEARLGELVGGVGHAAEI